MRLILGKDISFIESMESKIADDRLKTRAINSLIDTLWIKLSPSDFAQGES